MYAITNQLLKIPTAMFAAALVTTSLFYLMHLLVHSDAERSQETSVIRVVDATMPEIEMVAYEQIERPEPISEPPPAEIVEEIRTTEVGTGPVLAFNNEVIDLDPPGWNTLNFQDSEMIPIVRTTPSYPGRALQRGIEGFVVVSFSVDGQGNVINPSVTYAEPEGYFERSALQAITRWKYAAKVKNGEPVTVHGVQQRIVFELAR
ncbi:MAG: TonB family protein [Gammaproteobacteria bacterium]|nr:TonB family protein [Pseudomonadales bacterium]MCP5348139.1 TonB family protein [Pseudomonadales bacterium]